MQQLARLLEELLDLQRRLNLMKLLNLRQRADHVVHLTPRRRRVGRVERAHLSCKLTKPLLQLRVLPDTRERFRAREEVGELQ